MFKIPKIVFIFALFVIGQRAQSQSGVWLKASSDGFTPRYALTSSVLNGKIYVIGGINDSGFLNTIEIYDPLTDTWETLNYQGIFPPHFGHTTAIVNNKIYVIGGAKDQFTMHDSVYIYDPTINTWSAVIPSEGNTFTERFDLTSCVIGDKIYVIGGESAPYNFLNTIEIFDTKSLTWTSPLPSKDTLLIVGTPVSFVIDGKIYVVGFPIDTSCHCEVQIYSPQTNKWMIPTGRRMNSPRYFFASDTLGGKIFIVGGLYGALDIDITEVYDPVSANWTEVSTTGSFTARDYLTTSNVMNKLYVMGGSRGLSSVNTNEILSFGENGINSAKLLFNQRVFPNPATSILYLASIETPSRYSIIDVLGREVIAGTTLDHNTLAIDISHLPRGVYYVLVERPNKKGTFVIAGKFAAVSN